MCPGIKHTNKAKELNYRWGGHEKNDENFTYDGHTRDTSDTALPDHIHTRGERKGEHGSMLLILFLDLGKRDDTRQSAVVDRLDRYPLALVF